MIPLRGGASIDVDVAEVVEEDAVDMAGHATHSHHRKTTIQNFYYETQTQFSKNRHV